MPWLRYHTNMEKVSFNLTDIQNNIGEKWTRCRESETVGNLDPVYEYCRHVQQLYTEGYIGYLILPYSLVCLFSLEDHIKKDPRLLEIAELGADLELQDVHLDGGSESRKPKMEKLLELIRDLPNY